MVQLDVLIGLFQNANDLVEADLGGDVPDLLQHAPILLEFAQQCPVRLLR